MKSLLVLLLTMTSLQVFGATIQELECDVHYQTAKGPITDGAASHKDGEMLYVFKKFPGQNVHLIVEYEKGRLIVYYRTGHVSKRVVTTIKSGEDLKVISENQTYGKIQVGSEELSYQGIDITCYYREY